MQKARNLIDRIAGEGSFISSIVLFALAGALLVRALLEYERGSLEHSVLVTLPFVIIFIVVATASESHENKKDE